MKKKLVLCGFASLFLGAFLDNSRGVILPLVQKKLDLSYSQLSFFLILGCFSAFPAVLSLVALKQKFSQNFLLKGMLFFTLLVLSLGFLPLSPVLFFTFGTLLGICLSWFGSLCNFWVMQGTPVALRARFFCGLHVMYGVGSFFAPQVFGWVERKQLPYAFGYFFAIPVILFLLGLLFFFIKEEVWEKHTKTERSKIDSLDLLIVLTFAVYVAAEVMTSMWMQTALMQSKGFSYSEASVQLSCFFGFVVLSRLLCFFWVKTEWIPTIILSTLLFGAACIFLGQVRFSKAFAFAGMIGPFFPLFLSYIGHHFPERASKLTLIIMAFLQFTLGFCHLLLGKIADKIGIGLSFYIPMFLFLFAFSLFWLVVRKTAQGVTHEKAPVSPVL